MIREGFVTFHEHYVSFSFMHLPPWIQSFIYIYSSLLHQKDGFIFLVRTSALFYTFTSFFIPIHFLSRIYAHFYFYYIFCAQDFFFFFPVGSAVKDRPCKEHTGPCSPLGSSFIHSFIFYLYCIYSYLPEKSHFAVERGGKFWLYIRVGIDFLSFSAGCCERNETNLGGVMGNTIGLAHVLCPVTKN
jgi:hypothetical protein